MPTSMSDSEIVLKYIVSILPPEQKEELAQLLGENSTVSAADPDDLAQDALRGRIAMDRLPPRLHRVAMARVAPKGNAEDGARYDAMFPNAGRLR